MRWTEEEEQQLVKLYPTTPANQIARQLSKSASCIYSKAARLGLKKDPTPPPSMFTNNFNLISIEQAKELDEMALFREAWSLYYMQKRELDNPNLSNNDRQKKLNGLQQQLTTIHNIMKTLPEGFYQEEEDLSEMFITLRETSRNQVKGRRANPGRGNRVLVKVGKPR